MNEHQHEHCLNYLSVMQGMLSEARSKRRILARKLHGHPDLFNEVQKETNLLENSVGCIRLTLEFLDQFPELIEETDKLQIAE